MPLYVTSMTSVSRHGVFPVERVPPTSITATGTDIACAVGQFPWGPASTTIYQSTSVADFRNTFAPPGFTRTGSAYLMTLAAGFPRLFGMRVIGSTAVKASAALQNAVPTTICTVELKYAGTEGNSVTCTVAAADDGDANHFNLTVTRTSSSGTTSDVLKNLNFSGVGTDSTVGAGASNSHDITNALLVGAITKNASGRPSNASTTCSSGTNGTVNAATYTGTSGSGDSGLARLETNLNIRHVFCDDAGNSIRATVNAGVKTHVEYMGDRVGYIAGNSGLSASSAQADVANYRSTNVVYVDPWVYVYDDTDGTKRLIPGNGFAASLAANLSPSTSIAWKDDSVRRLLGGIVELESDRGDAAGTNTQLGISTLIPFRSGGFCFEAGKVTTLTSGKTNLTRTLMGVYIGASLATSLQSNVDAPNVTLNQQDIMNACDDFLGGLKANQGVNPNFAPYIKDYTITPVATANSTSSIDAGNFIVEMNVKTGSSMERIFPSIQYGETVRINNGV